MRAPAWLSDVVLRTPSERPILLGMSRPATLTIAVVLVWITAVTDALAAIGFFSVAATSSEPTVREAYEAAGLTGMSAEDVSGLFVMIAVLFLAMAVLEAVTAIFLGKGRSWARVVITVLLALSMVGDIYGLFQGVSELALSVVGLVLKVLVLWLMWNSRSNAWIHDRSSQRA